ncbi:MAG: PEP-CTERM sorting domain-containing protein [Opitutaceae bacterium]|jgi:autotransporter-associated beta strand protein
MKTPASTATRLAAACALATLLSVSLPLASADILTWDSGGLAPASPNNAAGTWNLTNAYWSNGSTDSAWVNANNDTASFGGTTAYTVTIGSGIAITAGGLTTTNAGTVTISAGNGSSSLTLAGATPTIGGAGTFTLNIAIQGSDGLAKTGNGTLRFNTAATYTGNTSTSGGQIVLAAANALPATTQLAMSNTGLVTMQNNQSLAGLSGLSTNTIRNTTASNWTLTITGGTNAFAGTLSETSTGTLALTNSGGTLALTGTNNYKGATIVSGGSLSFGSNLVNSSSVTVSGGTLTSTVANVNLGKGAVSMGSGAITPRGVGTAGTFTLDANQNFVTTGGTLNFDLVSSSNFDQIISLGSGAFSLTGTTLALSGLTSVAGTYQLFSGFTSGSVSSLTITGLTGGYSGSLDNTGLLTVTAIPEPSTYAALAGAAILGIAAIRRRKTRA